MERRLPAGIMNRGLQIIPEGQASVPVHKLVFPRWSNHMLIVLFFATLLFTSTQELRSWSVSELSSPAGPGSSEPNLAVSGKQVYMTWLETTSGNGPALRFAVFDGKSWSTPRTIVSNVPFFLNWADFPSLQILQDGSIVVHWLQKSGKSTYAYDVMISISTDGGKTWSKPICPHRDRKPNEHGFVSLMDEGNSSFSVVWLDSRNFKESEASSHDMTNEMSLMYSRYKDGSFQSEVTLDGRVCDCCQTAASAVEDGLFVAYRDRSDSEVRDISYVRFEKGKWSNPKNLYADGWQISGCPVNGPSVSAYGNKLVVAWFAVVGQQGRVQAIFSQDGGKSFGKPLRVDQGNPVGRVDVKWLSDGAAVVSWLENTGKGADIRLREIHPTGNTDPFFIAASSTAARSSGFPRIAATGKELILAWTVAGDPSRIHVMKLIP